MKTMVMNWKATLIFLGASIWSGSIGGTILGTGFGILVISEISVDFQGLENYRQMVLQMITRYSFGTFYLFLVYSGLGALIGAMFGSIMGLPIGVIIRVLKQVDKANFIGVILGLIIMGLFCYQMSPLFLSFGLLIGGLGGLISGRQFQTFFEVIE